MATGKIVHDHVIQSYIGNIDLPPNGLYVLWATNAASGSKPTISGSNAYVIISMCAYTGSSVLYGTQMAISFSASVIAMRHASYNASGSTWSAWTYATTS